MGGLFDSIFIIVLVVWCWYVQKWSKDVSARLDDMKKEIDVLKSRVDVLIVPR